MDETFNPAAFGGPPNVAEALSMWRDTQSGCAFRAVVLAALEDNLVTTAEMRRAYPNHADCFTIAKLRNNSGSGLPHARAQVMIMTMIADRFLAAEAAASRGMRRAEFEAAAEGISGSTPSSRPPQYDRAAAMRDAPDLRRMAAGHRQHRL